MQLIKLSYDEIVKTNDIKLIIKQLSLLLLKMWIKLEQLMQNKSIENYDTNHTQNTKQNKTNCYTMWINKQIYHRNYINKNSHR